MCDPQLEPYMSRLKRTLDISKVRHCIQNINNKCRQRRIRATKVIRMTMQSVETVIRKIPDIHIVYYVRDPRGISESRHGAPIKHLCSTMQADHNDYLILKRKFPEVFHYMRYENLAMNTEQIAQEMFQFLNEPYPLILTKYLYTQTHNTMEEKITRQSFYRAYSTHSALAWINKISQTSYQQVIKHCRKLLSDLNYEL